MPAMPAPMMMASRLLFPPAFGSTTPAAGIRFTSFKIIAWPGPSAAPGPVTIAAFPLQRKRAGRPAFAASFQFRTDPVEAVAQPVEQAEQQHAFLGGKAIQRGRVIAP